MDLECIYCQLALTSVAVAVIATVVYRTINPSRMLSPLGKYVLITGCDTGFGHHLAKRLHKTGCDVIATCLAEDGDGASDLKKRGGIHVLSLDVTSSNSVEKCLEEVKKIVGASGLWALVNNAGVNLLGDVEFCTMDMYRQVAEVNLFGMIRVTKAFLPLIRKTKGRIVNVTSVKGLITDSHSSAYNITKYGAEAFSDSLRLEMHQFGATVVVIEPGAFGGSTGMMGNMERHRRNYDAMWREASEELKSTYGDNYIEECFQKQVSYVTDCDVTPVTDAMEDAILSSQPRSRYLVDGGSGYFDLYCVLARLKPFIPTRAMDWIVRRYL